MTHFLYPRRRNHLDAESRLCSFETLKKAANATWDFAAEWTKWGLEQINGAGVAIREQAKALWHMETRADMREESMRGISQFFQLASPDMIKLLDDKFKNGESVNSLNELSNLLDHTQWINAFLQPDLFDETKKPMEAFTMRKGPLGVLLGLSATERKRLFAGYVDQFIPKEVQREHIVIFGNQLTGSSYENAVAGEVLNITNAMHIMLGQSSVNSLPQTIARKALSSRYVPRTITIRDNATGVESKRENRANLHADFDKLTGGVPVFRDIRDLQSSKAPSLLKGAANLGVISNKDIADYAELARNRERERHAVNASSGHDVEQLQKVTKREIQREAKTMADMWHTMGGFEKLALVAAGAFALSIKGIRSVAIAGAGYYFLAKFFGKVDKPLKPLEKMAVGGTKMFFELPGIKQARESLGITTNLTTQESIDRGKVVSNFLADDAKEDIDMSVTGFRLLYDMPLDELAQYVDFVDVQGGGRSKGVLRTWDPNFQKRGRQILRARGVDRSAIEKFFADTRNAPVTLKPDMVARLGVPSVGRNAIETGDALATVYYLIGAEDARLAADVQFVDAARDEYGGSYDRLLDSNITINGRTDNAKELFLAIARAGQERAPTTTLGNYMADRMGLRQSADARVEAVKDARFMDKRYQLEAYTHMGKQAKLSARDKGNVVEIGRIDGLSLTSPIIIPKTDFLSKSTKEIAVQWVTPLIAKHKADILAAVPVGYTYGKDFDVKGVPTDAELVGFAPVLDIAAAGIKLPVAETSAYKFIQVAPADILAKYEIYEKALATGMPMTGKDPL